MNTRPSVILGAPALAVLLTALALSAPAQDTAPPASQAPSEEAVDEAREAASRDGPAIPAEAPAEAGSGAAGPLEDYEASEQISEDLSVSFPVDI